MSYPFNVRKFERPSVSTTAAGQLSAGDVITSTSDMRTAVITNGLFKLDGQVASGQSHPTAHIPYLRDLSDGSWLQLGHSSYGDWSYFVAPTTNYDSMTVLEASGSAVEVAWRITAQSVLATYPSGITMRDPDGSPVYYDNGVLKTHTTIAIEKRVRFEEGLPGYFMSWWSEPRMGPSLKQITAGTDTNTTEDFGEREFGPGHGAAVCFSSNSDAGACHSSGWRTRSVWTTVETAIGHAVNRHWWAGIRDPLYGDYAHASYAQSQGAGFPRVQSAGPWWIADIPNWDGAPAVCRYAIMQRKLEAGGWCFSTTCDTSCHFCHSPPDGNGRPMTWQVFYGSFAYTADSTSGPLTGYTGDQAYANEPTSALRSQVNTVASQLAWPK